MLIREEVRLPDAANLWNFALPALMAHTAWGGQLCCRSSAARCRLAHVSHSVRIESHRVGLGRSNCLEITRLARSHFLAYVVIRAFSLHIQKGAMLQSKPEREVERRDGD
jgi:hypothetical protein